MTITLNRENITYEQLAKTIDHSLLNPAMTVDEVTAGCELAKKYNVASVCVKPCHVTLAAELLKGTTVEVGTVVGFPHGGSTTATKVFEAEDAISNGATELDMVLNIGELKSGNLDFFRQDIAAVVQAASGKALVKVILENAYLSRDEIRQACVLCEEAGADFVKTSTGYAPSGATLEDLKLMRETVSPQVQVKAAGGVRSLEAILDVIDVGVTRVGATATAKILDDFQAMKNVT
jgi:deoxyribose-phosphate aldolase